MLLPLFGKISEQEEIPRDWKDGHIIKLPKKEDLSSCENYRGITLLSELGRVFNRTLLESMRGTVDVRLRDHQAGFRRDRSCSDQIATLRIIVESPWSGIPHSTYINLMDFRKSVDSLHCGSSSDTTGSRPNRHESSRSHTRGRLVRSFMEAS
jgi:hypothetical protein